MSLLPADRDLLQRCLGKHPGAWNDFVDRFLSLIYHVVKYSAHLRSAPLAPVDVEDIAQEVLLQIVADDYKLLRQFKGNANLSTYLTVVARRISVHELTRRQNAREAIRKGDSRPTMEPVDESVAAQKSVESLDEVEQLLRKLSGKEREIVRQFYLEGRSYEEISGELDIPVNSIGAILSRARKRLREMSTVATSDAELPALKAMVEAESKRGTKPNSPNSPSGAAAGKRRPESPNSGTHPK
ncbi:MAG: sigma-70 family RNA polymerase sigma factor [Bacteroidales bacterium]|nr:sigma-70 family RNA polymerase sigma factor [Bacteroidales bacterium]